MIRRMVLVFAFAFFLLPIAAANGYNSAYQMNAVFRPAPNIDGVIAGGEWDDASTVSFNNTIVYLKQDGRNLYVAFNVSDNTVSIGQDALAIFVDVQNNGGSSPQSDDILFGAIRGGQLTEKQGNNPPGSPTGGWAALSSSTGSEWQVEFNITYAKIGITPGEAKTLGIAFESWDYSAGLPCFWPPMTPMQSNSPSNWGDLVSEENWVPEFQPLTAALILVPATILAIMVYKRKHTPTSSRLSSNFNRRISQI
jgi:hypothetical protein